jgi:hypothetical protein
MACRCEEAEKFRRDNFNDTLILVPMLSGAGGVGAQWGVSIFEAAEAGSLASAAGWGGCAALGGVIGVVLALGTAYMVFAARDGHFDPGEERL